MAWYSGEDIIKDLADLDEFDGYGNNDSYNILDSLGRGIKSKENSKNSNTFIDPRNGEEIHPVDSDSDVGSTFYKTKGRGNVLGFSSNHSNQLQKQLRLARPLGSSDMIFESFWKRNIPNNKTEENSVSASNSESNSESESQNSQTSNALSEFVLHSSKNKNRVIAYRNSKLQSNALINNLLTKNFQKTENQNT